MDELVIKAAQNNADWCDIVCRTHDVPGEFLENIWINQQEVPTLLYPNAVIIKPLSDKRSFSANKALNEVIQTLKKIPLETYAIKDSFNELPVDKMECKILFEAEWITYPNEVIHESIIEDWTIIKDEEELKNWEYAWNNNQLTDKRIFLPSILSVKDVFFLAKYNNGQIVAGGIINISRDVVGLSNVFTQENINFNVYTEVSIFIKEKISTLPIVGYDRDKALVQAHEAGFKTIGKLKVLLKSMKKPVQYLLVGFPYSGKTTLAKELEKRFGLVRLSVDEVKFSHGFEGVSDNDVPDEDWKKIFEDLDNQITENLKNEKSLINEYPWITKEWRDKARKIASDLGIETKTIFVDVPEKVVRERWLKNKDTNERFHVADNVFKEALRDFERPTENEKAIIYNQTIPVEEWIKQNLTD